MKNFQLNHIALPFIKRAILSTALIASIAQASPAIIPAEFIGRYESKPADCRLTGDAQDMSEHIYINKSGYSGFEYSCQAVSTIKKSSGQYVGKMNCSGAGEDDLGIETISFQLQPNKKFKLTQNDGKKVYVNQYFKCSK